MAETYWPFANIDTTTTQYSQWARNIGEGVKGSSATTDLKVTAPGGGMTVSLAAGQALIRGHYYYNTAALTLTVTTANATLPRIDSVVLTLDPSLNTIVASIVAGTAAASPVAPTLTQTDAAVYQIALANIAVAAATATISSGNVTDVRPFLGNVSLTGVQTLTNKTLTAPNINNPVLNNGGVLTLPTTTDTLVGRATVDTLTNKTFTAPVINNALLVSPLESVTVSAVAASGTINYDVASSVNVYYTVNATANFTLNFRANSSTTLNTFLPVGQSIAVVFQNTNGASAFYASTIQIDGTTVTPKWQGGIAPSAGNASAIDTYSFVITKTAATPTYLVQASVVKFA